MGVWRIGRGNDPLRWPPRGALHLADAGSGNRFDSLTGSYSVLYFGTVLQACFGETLSRFRPNPRLTELGIDEDWKNLGYMRVGQVPAEWRTRRTAIRCALPEVIFLDIESPDTLAVLQKELGPALAMMGVDELDVAVARGPDRRVTRLISQWAWQQETLGGDPRFGGLRYLSRLSTDWECWAVFDDVEIEELERRPILPSMPEAAEVADMWELRLF